MKKPVILHHFLFAILPILFLYVHNAAGLRISELPAPLGITLALAVLLWLGLSRLMRNNVRTASALSFFWLWFFAWGCFYEPQPGGAVPPSEKGLHFFAGYCCILLVGIVVLIRMKRGINDLSRMFNYMAVGLVAWQIISIGGFEAKRIITMRRLNRVTALNAIPASRQNIRPNIYCIILDGYGRADVLQEIYQYDNSSFLKALEQRGFHVVKNSRANYCQTALSIASLLNLSYMDHIAKLVGPSSDDRNPLMLVSKENRLFPFLRSQGYRISTFSSGYLTTDALGDIADSQYGPAMESEAPTLSEFHASILKATPVPLLTQSVSKGKPGQWHWHNVKYTVKHLADQAGAESPAFVLAHVICPHPPFVFDRQGKITISKGVFAENMFDGSHFKRSKAEYIRGYREQVMFMNSKVQQISDQILARAKRPTVIIVLSDHGPGSQLDWEDANKTNLPERFGTLLAYRLPEGGELPGTDELTQVNLFRLVLNRYFGTQLETLPNESYYSTWSKPYRFIRVTDKLGTPSASASARRSNNYKLLGNRIDD